MCHRYITEVTEQCTRTGDDDRQSTSSSTSTSQHPSTTPQHVSTVDSSSGKQTLRQKYRILCTRTWKLKRKMSKLKQKASHKSKSALATVEDIVTAASRYLTPLQVSLLRCQMLNGMRKPNGFRWPTNVTTFALQLQYKSTAAYSHAAANLGLPSRSTLIKFVSKSVGRIEPGFSSTMFNIVKSRTENLSVADRQCSLVLDEMSLKTELTYNKFTDHVIGYTADGQLATHALVFLVRGLHAKWKQALSYILTHNTVSAQTLSSLIATCITKLQSVGLCTRCVVCDQASTNISALRLLGFTVDKPQIQISCVQQSVHVIFDVPHLIKNVRNNLQKYDISVGSDLCSWKHIRTFYENDKMQAIRLAPRLTDTHIDVQSTAKMRVKYAVQVLSHSVAAGMRTQIAVNQLTPEAKYTAEFVEKVDSLFDMLNSTRPFGDKPCRSAVSPNNRILNDLSIMLGWIRQWKFKSVRAGTEIKCVWGLQASITSVISLCSSLLDDGYKFVCTARFNQDCIENFFAGIRSKQGWHENPNSEQFSHAFRKSVVLSSLDSTSSGKNCISDDDFVLVSHMDIVASQNSRPVSNADISLNHCSNTSVAHNFTDSDDIPCEIVDTEQYTASEETLIVYLSGWVSRKVALCKDCQRVLTKPVEKLDEHSYNCRSEDVFASKKRYDTAASVGLVLPCEELCAQVHKIEEHFRDHFELSRMKSALAQTLYDDVFDSLDFSFLYNTHPQHALYLSQKITKLYIVMRIFYAVKFLNRERSAKKESTKRKSSRKTVETRKMQKILHI